MRRGVAIATVLMLAVGGLSACGAGSAPSPTASSVAAKAGRLSVEQPWVRTTTGTQDASMSAAYMTIVNPTGTTVKLTKASAADVAAMTQIHEMITGSDGKLVMQEAKDGLDVPAGSHAHLQPGGPHIMLMQLARELKIGDEVTLSLEFSDGSRLTVTAPVKQAPAETEPYHTHAPVSASPSR